MNGNQSNTTNCVPGLDSDCIYNEKKLESCFVHATSPMINLPGVGSTSVPLGNVPPQAAPAMRNRFYKPSYYARPIFLYESCVMKLSLVHLLVGH